MTAIRLGSEAFECNRAHMSAGLSRNAGRGPTTSKVLSENAVFSSDIFPEPGEKRNP